MFDLKFSGNAFEVFTRAAGAARGAIMHCVTKGAHAVQARAKVNVHQKLNTTGLSRGTLSRSITVLAKPERLEAAIGPSVIYGRIHELGGIIVPVRKKALAFKIGEELVITSKVTMPARPYLGPALEASEGDIREAFNEAVPKLFSEAPRLIGE